jgi:inhibitor of KinA sporulation pathway (predicted exonuclease)
MQIENNYYLIIDLEATCSQDDTVPRAEMEIIEIGAVLMANPSLEVISTFQTFVQPVRHPELTDFCRQLTGIQQVDVSHAPGFSEALKALVDWFSAYPDSLFCSWGDYDARQFQQDCDYHQIPCPFAKHLNIKKTFSAALGLRKRYSVEEALQHLGLTFVGSPHRGLDDAQNMARIIQTVLGQIKG